MGQWEAFRPASERLSPHLHSERSVGSGLVILGVFLLKAAWAEGWQEKSWGGRGLEPRTPSAHWPTPGSEPWASLLPEVQAFPHATFAWALPWFPGTLFQRRSRFQGAMEELVQWV